MENDALLSVGVIADNRKARAEQRCGCGGVLTHEVWVIRTQFIVELVRVRLVNRVPQEFPACGHRVLVFRPGNFGRVVISHLVQTHPMKCEPVEGFWETLLNVILQRVCELCQTEDDLGETRKTRRARVSPKN